MNSTAEVGQAQMLLYTRILAISSACCLSVLSIVTTTSNILLLIAIWKDPLKCFKSSAKYFIVGLSIADLITGITTEPFFAAYYFIQFFKKTLHPSPFVTLLYNIGGIISSVALKYSFLVVLALSWSQHTAISFPHHYRKFITPRNIIIFMVCAFMYLVLFTAVQFMGILDVATFQKIDVGHSTFLSANLLIVSLLLYRAYRRRSALRETSTKPQSSGKRQNGKQGREKTLDQQFTIVSIYLGAILLLCALPHVITVYIFLYPTSPLVGQTFLNLLVLLRMSDVLLFIKVCVDPFIYAWRLPNYRKTLLKLFPTSCHGNQESNLERGLLVPLTEKATSTSEIKHNNVKE